MAEYGIALRGKEYWLLERLGFSGSASGHFKIINFSCSVSVYYNWSADYTLEFFEDLPIGREAVMHNKRNILDCMTILFLMINQLMPWLKCLSVEFSEV